MPKLSYGPTANKRVAALFAVLMDYGNDALEEVEVAQLEQLRSHITVHWEGDRTLIVRTKLRYLQTLAHLAQTKPRLTTSQIKEGLKYLESFLGILQDNRASRRGSDVWHFTLTLWRSRWEREENLRQFDQQWQERRSVQMISPSRSPSIQFDGLTLAGLSQSKTSLVSSASDMSEAQLTFWRDLCQQDLTKRRHTDLTTNSLTAQAGQQFTVDQIYVPLSLVQRSPTAVLNLPNVLENDRDDRDDSLHSCSPLLASASDFFAEIWSHTDDVIAIIGEPGAGKTTLLQQLAQWLLNEQQAIPIWVSLADIGTQSLEDYLSQTWLRQSLRQLAVPPEILADLAQTVATGRVWLLLDAVDEMAMTASAAFDWVAKQGNGWLASARLVLTCRQNVWEIGNNALTHCHVYYCCRFSDGRQGQPHQMRQFIQGWFQRRPELGQRLQAELERSRQRRIRETVANPLQLALLCRTWMLTQGQLPSTKYRLYRQFVDALHLWKQECFPTSLSQQYQLQQVLGELAIASLKTPQHRSRVPHTLVHNIFAQRDLTLLELALQLGWLRRLGYTEDGVEPVYTFSHATFQDYFAAQAVADWRLFFEEQSDSADRDHANMPILCDPQWHECILLWLGREDIPLAEKEALIQALIEFNDGCGGFFSQRVYFLAAIALSECPDCRQCPTIISQLVLWGFQTQAIVPTPLRDGARQALSRTAGTAAIAALETFIRTTTNPFDQWVAAYSLGKNYDFGNSLAIATLEMLLETLSNPHLRINVARSLGVVNPGNHKAIAALTALLSQDKMPQSDTPPSKISPSKTSQFICKVALRLGQINPGNEAAIATLVEQMNTLPDGFARQCAQKALGAIAPDHPLLLLSASAPPSPKRHQRQRSQSLPDVSILIAATMARLATTSRLADRVRLARRLWHYQPGHPAAIGVFLGSLRHGQHKSMLKQSVAFFQSLPADQAVVMLPAVRDIYYATETAIHRSPKSSVKIERERSRLCYQLLWEWADILGYGGFRRLFRG